MEQFKTANMPDNFNYDLGVPADKTLPEFICQDVLVKITKKVQSLTLSFSRDTENVSKERGRLVEFEQAYDYSTCGKLP